MTNDIDEDKGRRPKLKVPPKSCDTHSHVYGPPDLYPLREGLDLRYAPVELYRAMLDRLGIERCVIVHSSFYGTDNRCSLDAIAELGQDRARGTAVIAPDTPKDEIKRLHDGGMRGVRISHSGDDLSPDLAGDIARLIAPFGWVLQIQGKHPHWIEDNAAQFAQMPVPVIFDHLGRTPAAEGAASAEFKAMVKLVETGRAWVKISGVYYSSLESHPSHTDAVERIRILLDARPDRLLWGLNWPFPAYPAETEIEDTGAFRMGSREGTGYSIEADSTDILEPLLDWMPDEKIRNMILAENPGKLFGFDN